MARWEITAALVTAVTITSNRRIAATAHSISLRLPTVVKSAKAQVWSRPRSVVTTHKLAQILTFPILTRNQALASATNHLTFGAAGAFWLAAKRKFEAGFVVDGVSAQRLVGDWEGVGGAGQTAKWGCHFEEDARDAHCITPLTNGKQMIAPEQIRLITLKMKH